MMTLAPDLHTTVASMRIRRHQIGVWLAGAALCSGCEGGAEAAPFEPTPVPAEVILAAGNIAKCGSTVDEATAEILDTLAGTIFTLGDNAFPDGTSEAYTTCYEPSWGRHRHRTYATLGNHEYTAGKASESFDYFGERAGPRDLGYYSLDLGSWHIIVLNISDGSSFESGSEQDRWLAADLAANTKVCTLAMWHSPRFFSSDTPGYTRNSFVIDAWSRLYAAGVDVVLNGHQHQYERFPPMTPMGARDEARGIRQFNAGTGGESAEMPIALSEDREVLTDAFGILKMTLNEGSYNWEFVPLSPGQFTDSGSATCH